MEIEGHGWLPWQERYRNFISLGATGLLAGVAATAFTAADMLIAGVLFGAVWLTSVLIILIAPNWSRRLKATALVAITLLLVALYGLAYYRHETPSNATPAPPPIPQPRQFPSLGFKDMKIEGFNKGIVNNGCFDLSAEDVEIKSKGGAAGIENNCKDLNAAETKKAPKN